MDFAEVLRGRRMVRNYKSDPVAEDVLRRIVRVVHRAPSAGFSQGHRLVVMTDAESRKRIADISEGPYLEGGHHPWISTAPVHVAIGIREGSYHERYQQPDKTDADGNEMDWVVPFWWFDSGSLFTLLQLAAVDEGLAAGFFCAASVEESTALGAVVGFADDVALVGVMTIGYAADDPAVPVAVLDRRRKPIDELVQWRRPQ